MTEHKNNGYVPDCANGYSPSTINSISGSNVPPGNHLRFAEEGGYSNGALESRRRDDDDENTAEFTIDEAEEDNGQANNSDQSQNNDSPAQTEAKPPKSCCTGLRLCWRRFTSEAKTTASDVKNYLTSSNTKNSIKKQCCSYDALKTYLPCLKWLPSYRWQHLKGDVIAGLTTGLAVLPQGLAYGQIVEVSAVTGLYSSFMGSFAYSLLGTSKDIAVGPSAIVSILTAQYGTGRSPVFMNPTYAIIIAFFTGIIQLALGIFRLGFLLSFISLPVLKGFRAAAGITIFMSRIKKWWGLNTRDLPPLGVPREFLPQLYWTLKKLPETNIYDFLLGGLCIMMLFTFKKLRAAKWKTRFRDLPIHLKIVKKIFWILGTERNIIVVTFAGAVVYGMLIRNINISYTGYMVPGVPAFRAPNFTISVNNGSDVHYLSDIASDIGVGFFFIPLVGVFETISIGKAFGRKGKYRIDYNQELIALGASNLLTSFVSGHPVTGAFLRSGINFNSGVKTPAGGILAAAVVLLSLAFVTPILSYIPTCAMAATIMIGAIDVISFHKVGFLWKVNKIDLIPWLFTFISSLTLGIEYGVFFGVAITFIINSWSSRLPTMKIVSNENGVITILLKPTVGFLYPAADKLPERLLSTITVGSTNTIILNMRHVFSTDSSIAYSLMRLHETLKSNNVKLLFSEIQPKVRSVLDNTWLKSHYLEAVAASDENHNSNANHHPTVLNGTGRPTHMSVTRF